MHASTYITVATYVGTNSVLLCSYILYVFAMYVVIFIHKFTYVDLNISKQCWHMANGKSQIRGMYIIKLCNYKYNSHSILMKVILSSVHSQ